MQQDSDVSDKLICAHESKRDLKCS